MLRLTISNGAEKLTLSGRLLALLAMAALGAGSAGSARAEWQFSAGAGESFTRRSDVHVRQDNADFTVHGVHWSGRGFEMPPWYDLRVTYYLPRQPQLGFTLNLLHMKVYADTGEVRRVTGSIDGAPIDADVPLHEYIQKFNISHGVNYIGFGMVGRLRWQRDARYPNGRIQPYAGLAIGPVINHPENTVNNRDNDPDFTRNHSWGTQATLGVQYALTPRWGVFSEARATTVSDDVPVDGGRADTRLRTGHVSAGIAYSF